ncbi:hypothetical protein [Paenibacillus taichungensis]
MDDGSSGKDYVAIKTLMARILRSYYVTDDIAEKDELQNKYTDLLEKSNKFVHVQLTQQEKQLIEKIEKYSKLFEEYHLSNDIIRKAEIEEIFRDANLGDEVN